MLLKKCSLLGTDNDFNDCGQISKHVFLPNEGLFIHNGPCASRRVVAIHEVLGRGVPLGHGKTCPVANHIWLHFTSLFQGITKYFQVPFMILNLLSMCIV